MNGMDRYRSWFVPFAAVMLFATAFLSGCNTRGDGTDPIPTPNPFAGSFSGTWTCASLGQNGTITMQIPTSGSCTGEFVSLNPAKTGGVIAGDVSSTGVVVFTVTYPGTVPFSCSGLFALAGDKTKIDGTVTQLVNGVANAVTIHMTKG